MNSLYKIRQQHKLQHQHEHILRKNFCTLRDITPRQKLK